MSYYYIKSGSSSHVTLPINLTRQTCSFVGDETFNFELHNHVSIELMTVVRSELNVTLDNKKYTLCPGDTILANPFVLHEGAWAGGSETGEYITLILMLPGLFDYQKSVLSDCAAALMEGRCQFDEFYPAGHPIHRQIVQLYDLYHSKSPTNEARCLATVFELVANLLDAHYHPTAEKSSFKRDVQFLRSVTAFINENYAKDITTADIAAALYMEMSQFCRIFRRHFGTSFSNHLCKYRIDRAADLKKWSDTPISEIAKAVGFRDYCYFSRSFKRYTGETPARYFGKWKKSPKEESK
ncbi:MAG: AraC family transcriptional regulator [Ruminococcaceae bacterium]|nr:AraC family transcriptional regulator [Oscillospiraceae bacterium]